MIGLEIARRRLRNQHLSGAPLADPVAVVRHLGAVQAQEHGVAKWSLAQRSTGIGDAVVQRLVDEGVILRTHVLRPTWHFVAPADIVWMQALTAPRVRGAMAYYDRKLGLDDALFATTNRLLTDALRGGEQLTRAELAVVLGKAGIEASGQRLGHIVMRAELDALICNGAMRGKQHTYALLSERAPDALRLSPDEALAELTRRYFISHGPATTKDFMWWSSLTATQVKRGLELAGSQLVREEIGGRVYWSGLAAPVAAPEASPALHLLQTYDEYVVSYTESKDVFDVTGGARAAISPPARFSGVIVLDSQVVGTWRRTLARRAVTIETDLVVALDDTQARALAAAAAHFGQFLGVPALLA
jgi:hypothetical protein